MPGRSPNSQSGKGEPPFALYPEECWHGGCCVTMYPKPGAIRLNHALPLSPFWWISTSQRLTQGLIPRNPLPLPFSSISFPFEGILQPSRMIRVFKRGQCLLAQKPPIDWAIGITFYFDRFSILNMNKDATTSIAETTRTFYDFHRALPYHSLCSYRFTTVKDSSVIVICISQRQ